MHSTRWSNHVAGVLIIFTWRIFAKSLFHIVLPPIFRFLAQLVTLPHRRFYTPATDYKNVPPEKGLRPIPSVIDLPGMVEMEMDEVAESTARRQGTLWNNRRDIKLRNGRGKADGADPWRSAVLTKQDGMAAALEEYERKGVPDVVVKHYDADGMCSPSDWVKLSMKLTFLRHCDAVLTKVFVYCGIGILANSGIPVIFEVLGWGVKMS